MKKYFADLINNEYNQKLINKVFISMLFAFLGYQFAESGLYYYKLKSTFFFSSDRFENFICLILAFILYYKISKSQQIWHKLLGVIISSIIFFTMAIIKMNRRELPFDNNVFKDFTSYIGLAFIFIALFYFFNNLGLFLNNSYVKIRQALLESEQQLLRQRFNPHFLYNAFNSLYSMSLANNPKTPDSILKLSSMMRYMTDKSNSELSFVKNEIKFINDYIEMEKIRFGKDANISFKYKDLPEDILLEPLLLIPLVENAFKHGFYTNKKGNFVKITVELTNQTLTFSVINKVNKKQHFQIEKREGKGLLNLRKRLDLSYKNRYSLTTKEDKNQFLAVLKIKLDGKI